MGWSWRGDTSPKVSFCVWALIQDGLRVTPFEGHRDGDGRLRAAGLDEAGWMSWVTATVKDEERLSELVRAQLSGPASAGRDEIVALAERPPGAYWPMTSPLRSQLDTMWAAYQPMAAESKRAMSQTKLHTWLSGRQHRELWRDLAAFEDRLPTLIVYEVEYPQPAVLPLPPVSCVLSLGDLEGKARGKAYAELLMWVARELAEA